MDAHPHHPHASNSISPINLVNITFWMQGIVMIENSPPTSVLNPYFAKSYSLVTSTSVPRLLWNAAKSTAVSLLFPVHNFIMIGWLSYGRMRYAKFEFVVRFGGVLYIAATPWGTNQWWRFIPRNPSFSTINQLKDTFAWYHCALDLPFMEICGRFYKATSVHDMRCLYTFCYFLLQDYHCIKYTHSYCYRQLILWYRYVSQCHTTVIQSLNDMHPLFNVHFL